MHNDLLVSHPKGKNRHRDIVLYATDYNHHSPYQGNYQKTLANHEQKCIYPFIEGYRNNIWVYKPKV